MTQYKTGDKVIITGCTDDFHHFAIGTKCEILGQSPNSRNYELEGPDKYNYKITQWVNPQDFKLINNNMTTLHEQINYACEHGYYPIVSNGEEYIIVSPFKDNEGRWRDTALRRSLAEATSKIGGSFGFSADYWQNHESEGYKITGYYKPRHKRFEAGEKVKVVENLEEVMGQINNGRRELASRVCEIKEVFTMNYHVYTPDKSDYWSLPHEALEPYFETPEKQTIKVGDDEYVVTDELLEALKGLKKI